MTFPKHLSSPTVFIYNHAVAQFLVFCVVFCRSFFVLFPFFILLSVNCLLNFVLISEIKFIKFINYFVLFPFFILLSVNCLLNFVFISEIKFIKFINHFVLFLFIFYRIFCSSRAQHNLEKKDYKRQHRNKGLRSSNGR